MKKASHVVLNLGISGNSPLPDPLRPLIEIDGVAIESVRRIEIIGDASELTLVRIELYAEVSGELIANVEKKIMDESDRGDDPLAALNNIDLMITRADGSKEIV